jgi:cobalt-zinc-cadmium efflux system outer membrane protein
LTRQRSAALAACAAFLTSCASVPRDSGFAEVRQRVIEETRQPVEWDPSRPVEPPDDAAVGSLLQEELTPERAVQIGFANNRDLQATLEGLGLARADFIAASTIRNPILDGEIRFPGNPAKPFELGLSQSLMDILRLGTRKKLGQAQFEAARLQVTAAVINFSAQVRRDYYDLLAARRILARQQTILKAQEATTELAVRQHSSGNISDLDLENEQSRYEQVKLDSAAAQLEELQVRERLITDLGLVQRADLRLPDDFPPPAPSEMTADEVEAQVVGRRLDIQMATREIELARNALGLSKTAVIDDLAVGAHHEREPDGKRTTGPAASIPIPIFNRGEAQKTRARAMVRQAEQRLAALKVTARSEARAAQERVLESRSRVRYLREVVVPRRERILNLTLLEYNAMLRGVFQLIEARQELARAQRDEVMATRDYWVARTELETALNGVGRFSVRPETPEGRRSDISASSSRPTAKAHE